MCRLGISLAVRPDKLSRLRSQLRLPYTPREGRGMAAQWGKKPSLGSQQGMRRKNHHFHNELFRQGMKLQLGMMKLKQRKNHRSRGFPQ